ncbi:CAF17-like 4Fe-4S cluster assembly/insertion protein YgfZ [Micromonospora sp. NBC_01813]|uniref:CAF17-like 4Fe-4S cluster assembly/insertion protein YgfZ n=1 Tax=Micromonospora sp. NBC_01813 TaxID=2975988 RepID=UPI002DD9BAA0|nr:folate-binding protein [Micromonospora sp. NBC_01813]WSA06520.1 folate-binding protein [Micromonospora sp. NBC_01813]
MMNLPGAVDIAAVAPGSRDAGVAAHYGDPMREQRRLATEVGLVDRSNRGVLAVPGVERIGWLHTLTTQHLATLQAGQGTELLVLSPNGHVEQHAMVAEDGATTWLDTEPLMADELLAYLLKMRFFTQVDPAVVTADWALLSLVGPGAVEAAGRLGVTGLAEPDLLAVPGPKFAAGSLPGRPTTLYAVTPLPADGPYAGGWARRVPLGVDLLVPRAAMAQLVTASTDAGVAPAGLWAYEAIRVESRTPRVGLETDHRAIPAEVGLLGPAVHLDKGCYRGQETVARVHNLGRPPRRLVLLHLDGVVSDTPPDAGTPLTLDGRAVGFVGTAVRHHELGMVALAVLKRNVPDDAELRAGEFVAAIEP